MNKEDLKYLISGCLGGMSGVFVGFPLEVIRVRMQTQSGYLAYKNSTDCLIKTWRGEGIRGFYKGMMTPLLGVTLFKTSTFWMYGMCLRLLNADTLGELKYSHIAFSGVVGGMFNSFLMSPTDRIKILLQLQRSKDEILKAEKKNLNRASQVIGMLQRESVFHEKKYLGPIDVIKEQRWSGLMRGYTACLSREIVYSSVYFPTFEFFKRIFKKQENISTNNLPFYALLVSGGCSGVIGWSIIFPIDVVKSRMQSEIGPVYNRRSMYDVAINIYKTESLSAFYKGIRPALLRAFPVHAVVLSVYATVIDFLNRDRKMWFF
eukprot:TRINITY_DN13605_c0_g1_i1.p1 TRINITY_DN13605_c0_g1~~TRINITY_DN13605_c0_g1_i1.p1  ORF type:complete len:319 (-),score=73.71 TRINITY_DN13605_c0_g1_i1:54-1010(-)